MIADNLLNQVRFGYNARHNGIGHADLTRAAHERLEKLMQRYGNTLSGKHRKALYELCWLYTEMAQHQRTGRWAFPLPTGLGKSLSVVSWIAELAAQKLDHVSVAVACSHVEALYRLHEALREQGVPDENIGLRYSDGYRYPDG